MTLFLQNVTKKYGDKNEEIYALDKVNLKVEQGDWVTIVGPSGSGKTTLLNCIAGMDQPDSGKIYNNNQNLSKLSRKDLQIYRRTRIGYVFQDFRLLDQYSVLDNVILPQVPYQSIKLIRNKAIAILNQLGMSARMDHFPRNLSGGEKQRTAVARALLNRPSLLICDEPTGNLDRSNRNQILDILSQLHYEEHTILLVTHDPEVSKKGDHLYYIRDGKLRETNK